MKTYLMDKIKQKPVCLMLYQRPWVRWALYLILCFLVVVS